MSTSARRSPHRVPVVPTHRTAWPASLLVSAVASAGALAVMFWLRAAYQIRTLPERVMEWVLIYVSPDTLERGLAQFGAQAKVYALYVAVAGMALILLALGAALVRYARSPWLLVAVGPLLYLLAMGVIMPVTGAGPFGTDLLQDWRLVNAGYLAVALSYGMLLVIGQWAAGHSVAAPSSRTRAAIVEQPRPWHPDDAERPTELTVPGERRREVYPRRETSRRAALVSLGSTLAAAIATLWLGQRGGAGSSSLPLARVQITPRPAAPAPTSAAGYAPSAAPGAAAPDASPGAVATPAAPSAASASPPPAAANPVAGVPASAGAAPGTSAQAASAPTEHPRAASSTAEALTDNGSPVAAAPGEAASPAAASGGSAETGAGATGAPAGSAGKLPRPAVLAKQEPRDQDGAAIGSSRKPGTLAPLITGNADFYHVTKNPVADPLIQPETWTLALDGEVNSPVQLDYATLRQLPSVEIAKTLECVSNLTDKCELVPFGCELIGTARWTGVRLSDVLELAGGLKPGVVTVAMIGEDEFVSAIPPEAALDPNTILAYEMNGSVLPYEHGYPARVLVPGRYGYKSPKWIRVIRPSSRGIVDWYGQRNWNRQGIVRTMTRIDVPAPSATLSAGPQQIAGIAYASDRGISKVEYSADGGDTWAAATFLEPQPGVDSWVRWQGSFDLPAGATLTLVARATDGAGTLQEQAFSLAQPDGGAGWSSIQVTGA